ncbi:MAG TPA: hypothetical protein VMD59_11190, partial [Acidimicrobiales bacterium]|nr:hypothetical protein [Acidimicrobiales bacterium]
PARSDPSGDRLVDLQTPGAPLLPARLAAQCVPVPPSGHDVCPLCHGYRRRGFALCSSCQRVAGQLSTRCSLVVPVSLAAVGSSPLYRLLCAYKDRRRLPSARRGPVLQVARLLAAFLAGHGHCIEAAAGGAWDGLAAVPSSSPRVGKHPLVEVARLVAGDASLPVEIDRGPAQLGHLRASDLGFVARGVAGRRLLVLDDTWTSGARAQSAASALRLAGADVVAVVPVARLVRPGFRDGSSFWQRQQAIAFDPARCCLEP